MGFTGSEQGLEQHWAREAASGHAGGGGTVKRALLAQREGVGLGHSSVGLLQEHSSMLPFSLEPDPPKHLDLGERIPLPLQLGLARQGSLNKEEQVQGWDGSGAPTFPASAGSSSR